jgi:hypothetical protein
LCETCGKPGELLCCSTCNLVFHLGCTRPKLVQVPECDWSCAFCVTAGDIVKSTSKQERNEARIAVREIEALKEEVRSEELRRRPVKESTPWIVNLIVKSKMLTTKMFMIDQIERHSLTVSPTSSTMLTSTPYSQFKLSYHICFRFSPERA